MSRTLLARAAGLALVLVLAPTLAGCGIINTLTGNVSRDDSGTAIEDNGNADVFTIRAGDCLDDATVGDDEVDSLPLVTCDQPHDTEVVAVVTAEGEDYPGDEAIGKQAEELCVAEFEEYVGLAYADSMYQVGYYTPTSGSWQSGDREIVCTVYDPAGKIETTLESAGK